MLKARDFRRQAWDSLNGLWGTMALVTLVFVAIMSLSGGIPFGFYIIGGPLTLGATQIYMSIIRKNRKPEIGQLFDGFNNFGSSLILMLLNQLLIFLWTMLFIIPGIIKSYSYSMSYYVLADNPAMSPNDARKKSMELMKGNKWRLFCLDFSFIGWELLTIITFGIASFWVTPYKEAAYAAFYQNLLVEQGLVTPEAPAEETYADTAATDI